MNTAMQQAWLEARVEVPRAAAEAVANYLVEMGSPGLATEERDDRICLVAYFDDERPMGPIHRYLDVTGLRAESTITTQWIKSENWAENWKAHFRPITVGRRLFICPPWSPDAPPERLRIVIDPGMAFGTGHHATTRGCLELLDRFLDAPPATALDVGTGSGILAIALARLGVRRIVAVDVDPVARAAAAENAVRNGVRALLTVVASLDETVDPSFPLVLANLQIQTLIELRDRLVDFTQPDGLLIASGLLRSDVARFTAAFSAGWAECDRIDDGEWTTLALRRQP